MRIPILILLFLTGGAAGAETVYVNDMLRVGVRGQPDSDQAALAVVTTGDTLEVLERSAGYVKIRTDEGTTGWVSGAYLTEEPPARLRIEQLTAESNRLQQEVEALKASSNESLAASERLRGVLAELREENAELRGRLSLYEPGEAGFDSRWLYAGALLVLFLLGFYFGVRQQKRRVSRRLGGLEL